jgi:IclR family acetate operon transcriptional repressor
MSLTELSEKAGLPPSTTHRLLTTLEAERFVRPNPSNGLWQVGVSAFVVGASFARTRDKLAVIRPYLKRLMELSGETANLFVFSDNSAVCIGQIESRHAMRAITGVGGRVDLHSSAAGKVLLGHSDPALRRSLVDALPMPVATSSTIKSREALLEHLDHVRRAGFAFDDEEHESGLRCVSAPVFDEFATPIAAVSVSGPTARIPRERLPVLGEMVREVGVEATREFGGITPADKDAVILNKGAAARRESASL